MHADLESELNPHIALPLIFLHKASHTTRALSLAAVVDAFRMRAWRWSPPWLLPSPPLPTSHSCAPLARPPPPLFFAGSFHIEGCTNPKKKKEKEEREGEGSGRKGHRPMASLVVDLLLCCLALDGARAGWGGRRRRRSELGCHGSVRVRCSGSALATCFSGYPSGNYVGAATSGRCGREKRERGGIKRGREG